MSARRPLSGWGRVPVLQAQVRSGTDLRALTVDAGLSRGLGRAYGDAALATHGPVVLTPRADRMLAFDRETGVLRAEAGLSQRDLMRALLHENWFTPVSAGTQYVTLGGMVASDIHGKNHHVNGTFGRHVRELLLRVGTGEIVRCSREQHPDLFAATLGGMGLTGHILEVEVQLERLPSPWIWEETERHDDLAGVFEHLNAAGADWPMTVSWVDTSVRGAGLGRGIVMRGRWAEPDEAPEEAPAFRKALTVPDMLPGFLMNGLSIRAMNALYFWAHGSAGKAHVVGPESYYYQLDLLREWNRGYGKKGFTQYQCVMPRDRHLYADFLRHLQNLGGSSFVTVFKDCGPEGSGLLSFPKEGTTLAIDLPMHSGIQHLIDELNAFVVDHGGRIYLAKDAFTKRHHFERMYPRLDAFKEVRARWDPDRRIRSALSARLLD